MSSPSNAGTTVNLEIQQKPSLIEVINSQNGVFQNQTNNKKMQNELIYNNVQVQSMASAGPSSGVSIPQ